MKTQNKLIAGLFIFLSFIIISSKPVYAGSEATCIFLLIEPGSRPNGMGHSFVSIAEGGFTSYWNPGGLGFIKDSDLGLMHSNWFGDLKEIDDMYYEFLGYAQFWEGIGTLGFNITYMLYGDQEAYDKDGKFLQNFTSYEIAVGASYGTQIKRDLGIGINFKGVISGLCPLIPGSDMTAAGEGYTFVIDLGLLKKNLIIPRLSFGVNLQNLGPDMTYANSDSKQPMPLNLRAGLSYRILDSKYSKMIASVDINKMLVNNDPLWKRWFTSIYDDGYDEFETLIENFGVEYKYYNLISLRVGYVNDVAGHITGVSFGGGICYEFSKGKVLSFDFALQPAGELTTNNKTFSLGLSF
ncbi:MAG: PorV/PorQ family protein [Candidatus Cloacimonetes bacterium]|nr:PorV/PorQ family protein [Candidatus Cloacimonadota bacterium]